ncbi:hypothetical protein [Bradyrhizobium canariense]|uniref:hypothetical protein n=1 Tax=Bradyrhizobium canariense TaxID=255045 RepID=UPI0011BAD324|nr:hypothetical protein [Bradyrhizobium canariense]
MSDEFLKKKLGIDPKDLHSELSGSFQELRLDLGGMQEQIPASCRLARMMGDWYLRKTEKQPNEVQAP